MLRVVESVKLHVPWIRRWKSLAIILDGNRRLKRLEVREDKTERRQSLRMTPDLTSQALVAGESQSVVRASKGVVRASKGVRA